MAEQRIASYVHVAGVLLVPGDAPPPALADQVTNPKAWGTVAPPAPAPVRWEPQTQENSNPEDPENEGTTGGETGDQGESPDGQDPDEQPDGGEVQAPVVEGEDPPRPGKSAKVETWREYVFAVADVTKAELADLAKDQLIEMADQLDNEQ